MKPVFDETGLAIGAGDIRCFYYDPVTSEYNGWSDEFINIGVSMPGNSTDIDPGEDIAGKVAVFTDGVWKLKEDHRGQTVWSTNDGRAAIVDYIGEIKPDFTTMSPSTPFDIWGGGKWVTDTEAQRIATIADAEREKLRLKAVADDEISWRQDAVDAGIATAEETAALSEWKKYRVLLMRIDTANPVWPTPLGEQAS
ncbi:tail fiber assembly protein [Citrobacter freundii]|uniref:tail fiber assembly protein n=1 Tax=Citrobacter freundii TaxID=546 RepID=UPI0028F7F936|nr:tail fiber assembly protein [Citrobacter freundii]MDT9809973.1 tail fiber assembly protein [Citrobacter freundii]MDT9846263.1 tail fiber assembly protein [Citrobacter freundii]